MAELDLKRILLDMLDSPAMRAQGRELNIQYHLEVIRHSLWAINSVMMDAQLRALKETDLEEWVKDASAAMVDVEDVLQRILDWQSPPPASNLLSRSFPDIQKAFRHSILLELKKIAPRLNYLVRRGDLSSLRKEMMDSMNPRQEEFSTILRDEVVGREGDKKEIIQILQRKSQNDDVPSFLHILGRDGMGKTTLAWTIYHHLWVRQNFHHRIWVDSPNSFYFDHMKIARYFTESIIGKPCSHDQRRYLQAMWLLVNERLGGGKYFLILNDVKINREDTDKWSQLLHIFLRVGGAGSRVVIVASNASDPKSHEGRTFLEEERTFLEEERTFMREEMPLALQSFSHTYFVEGLSKKDWETLFSRHALTRSDQHKESASSAAADMQLPFATMMYDRSDRSPLRAKLWGSAFRYAGESRRPEEIDTFGNAGLLDEQYFHLLPFQYHVSRRARIHLYYSILPPDYTSDLEDLLQMLTAQGFIQHSSDKEAVMNHLRRELEDGEVGRLAAVTASKLQIYMTMTAAGEDSRLQQQCRHLCLHADRNTSKFPTALSKQRTLMINLADQKCQIPENMFENFRDLRVLDLRATMISEIRAVDKMHNLRYLNLSRTEIKTLPESCCNLRNLQTLKLAYCGKLQQLTERIHNLRNLQVLKLAYCEKLQMLPKSFTALVNLQELDLEGCQQLATLPEGLHNIKKLAYLNILFCSSLRKIQGRIKQLTNLQKLFGGIAIDDHGNVINELKGLENLEDVRLENLERVSNSGVAKTAMLHDKLKLKYLALHWKWKNMEAEADTELSRKVLNGFKTNTVLRKLEIISYAGEAFPDWMGNEQPHHYTLVEIKLVNLRRCQSLPPLGQLPRLRVVEISGMDCISSVDEAFYGDKGTFPWLKKLTFSEMPNLEKWQKVERENQLFPRLTELTLIQCPKFKEMKVSLGEDRSDEDNSNSSDEDNSNMLAMKIWLNNETLWTSKFKDWNNLKYIRKLEIFGCEELTCLPEGMLKFESLQSLKIVRCHKLVSLPDWIKGFKRLRSLSISCCTVLESMPERPNQLRHLIVEGCPRLPNSSSTQS